MNYVHQFSGSEKIWPTFIQEPPNKLFFYNSTGAILSCRANGHPEPSISWMIVEDPTISSTAFALNGASSIRTSSISSVNNLLANNRLKDLPGVLHSRPDGSLVFPPFSPSQYN